MTPQLLDSNWITNSKCCIKFHRPKFGTTKQKQQKICSMRKSILVDGQRAFLGEGYKKLRQNNVYKWTIHIQYNHKVSHQMSYSLQNRGSGYLPSIHVFCIFPEPFPNVGKIYHTRNGMGYTMPDSKTHFVNLQNFRCSTHHNFWHLCLQESSTMSEIVSKQMGHCCNSCEKRFERKSKYRCTDGCPGQE